MKPRGTKTTARPSRLLVIMTSLLFLGLSSRSAHADSTVVFNEIMYHPFTNEAELEWIELYNQMAVDMDISHWYITGGITFQFPEETIVPGGRL